MNVLLTVISVLAIPVLMWLPNPIDDAIFFNVHPGVTTVSESPARLLFTGDLMIGRHIETLSGLYGEQYPFEKITKTLESHDAVIANLEGPLVAAHAKTPNGSFEFSFPTTTATLLKREHIEYVTLANNHTYDQGDEVLQSMRQYLGVAGVTVFGDPIKIGNASFIATTIAGRNVVLVGYNATYTFDTTEAVRLVQKTQEEHQGAYIVVCIHWGEEYELLPTGAQHTIGQALIDGGADVVIGSHPHVVQGVELYKGKPIFYSLGNFIFDQYFSDEVKEGLLVGVSLGKDVVTYSLFPISIDRGQPRLMEGGDRNKKLRSIAERSSSGIQKAIEQGEIRTPW
jgi:poly-gamma-glutamate synthesis protein (capsule biosynthesis protein)